MSVPPPKVPMRGGGMIPPKFTSGNQRVYWAFLQGIGEGCFWGVGALLPKSCIWEVFTQQG